MMNPQRKPYESVEPQWILLAEAFEAAVTAPLPSLERAKMIVQLRIQEAIFLGGAGWSPVEFAEEVMRRSALPDPALPPTELN